jgi:hypothetical protein
MRNLRMRAGLTALGLVTAGLLGASLPATAASAGTSVVNLCFPVLQTTAIYAQPGADPIGTAYKGNELRWPGGPSEDGYVYGQDGDEGNGYISGWVALSALGQLTACT